MSECVLVNRWRRYGKDRLYVTQPDESKVGWWDLVTGEAYPESPEHLPALLAAVEQWNTERVADADALDTSAAPADVSEPTPPGAPGVPEDLPTAVPVPDLPASAETTTAPDDAVPVARPWIDLTTNRAGTEAREQALAAREAAPVKTFLARALGVHTDERAWRIGADGEEKVATQLAKAAKKDPRWRFLHAISVGDRGSDLDHLIIGPGGVFTANAKHHPKSKIWVGGNTFMVNGHKQPYIRNSRYEAARAAKLLTAACGFPVHVEGLIVTVNADDVTIKNAPDGVHVVPRMQVAKWLLRHGDILADETLEAIHDAARRSITWQP